MRMNEYNSLEEFTNEFIGEWCPSDGHWFGLDFLFNGTEYRLHTGSMYNSEDTILPDGRMAMFGVYRLENNSSREKRQYSLIGEYADMNDLLKGCFIENMPFEAVIMSDETVILGKD